MEGCLPERLHAHEGELRYFIPNDAIELLEQHLIEVSNRLRTLID